MSKTKNSRWGLALLFLAALCFGILSPLSAQADEDRVFTLVISEQRLNWNPLLAYTSTEAELFNAVYEGLVTLGPRDLSIEPGLAESWSLSSDKKTYTFNIRTDLRYSSGETISSADFRDTWLYMLSLGDRAPFGYLLDLIAGAKDFRTGKLDNPAVVGIEAPSPDTLLLRLSEPAPHFLSILSHQSLVPLPAGRRDDKNWPSASGIPASGAYQVLTASSREINLEKKQDYWDSDRVNISRLRFVLSDDVAKNTADFNAGQVDWIKSAYSIADIRVPNALQLNPNFGTMYYFFNTAVPELSDARVRRALALLVPYQALRNSDRYLMPTATIIPSFAGYPEPKVIEAQDVEEALALLEEAGYPNGTGLPVLRIVTSSGNAPNSTAVLIQTAWKEHLNIEVQVVAIPYEEQFAALEAGEFELADSAWVADYLDPLTLIELWAEDNPQNHGGFLDEEFEQLLSLSSTQQGTARLETLSKAESRLLETGTVIPLTHTPAINVIDLSDVDGWYANALDHHPFKYLKFIGARIPPGVAILTLDGFLAIVSR